VIETTSSEISDRQVARHGRIVCMAEKQQIPSL